MKTKSMLSMLLAAIAIAAHSAAIAQQGAAQHKYSDDAIVRDLKAGKLTVREAQMLQQRNERAAAKAETPAKAVKPARPLKQAKHAKPLKNGKTTKAAAPKKSKAPIRHLTAPHSKDKHKAVVHHTAAPAKTAGKAKSATAKPEPVRKTAVKYIR